MGCSSIFGYDTLHDCGRWAYLFMIQMARLRKLSKIKEVRSEILLAFFTMLLVFPVLSCGRRSPPRSLPASTAPVETAPTPSNLPALSAPQLVLSIEPSAIEPGDSALLQWETTDADHVVISHNIGKVEISGRIKFFPDQTTSYEVKAVGPGGESKKTVTVEVKKGIGSGFQEKDLPGKSLEELFEYFVKPVFFDYDSSELSEGAILTLEGNLHWLIRLENLNVRFLVEGHCDERGTEEYNLALGDRRAQIVKTYLRQNGVDASRVDIVSFGEERSFDTQSTEQGWALNRRAHFLLKEN